jgi:hypothetical protein
MGSRGAATRLRALLSGINMLPLVDAIDVIGFAAGALLADLMMTTRLRRINKAVIPNACEESQPDMDRKRLRFLTCVLDDRGFFTVSVHARRISFIHGADTGLQ